jgi:transketolase
MAISTDSTTAVVELAQRIRIGSLRMTRDAKSSHVGSIFSSAEILATLYGIVMDVRPTEPDWPNRDRFVMSKGHAAAGLYVALAEAGFIPLSRLAEFYVDGGSLPGHVTRKGIPGVEVSTGSLGHGLALSTGIAMAGKRHGADWRTFCLLSDGECDEGSTWEAALLAGNSGLARLTAIVDFNKIQSLGRVDEVMPLEPFADKWRSFGWETLEMDGHDPAELIRVLGGESESGRPRCVIAHTVKGKGVSFMEDTLLWHYRSPQGDEYDAALAELEGSK